MIDFWSHRRFTLRCIKVGINPVTCRLKNPLKTPKSYHIHQVEKQLLYERVRNINNTRYMYELKRSECYTKLENLKQDGDISQCCLLISKIKEFRHNKTRSRQKDKFNRLVSTSKGYFHNYSSFGTFGGHVFFGRHPQNTSTQHNAGGNTTAPTIHHINNIHHPAANGSSTNLPPLTPV